MGAETTTIASLLEEAGVRALPARISALLLPMWRRFRVKGPCGIAARAGLVWPPPGSPRSGAKPGEAARSPDTDPRSPVRLLGPNPSGVNTDVQTSSRRPHLPIPLSETRTKSIAH